MENTTMVLPTSEAEVDGFEVVEYEVELEAAHGICDGVT